MGPYSRYAVYYTPEPGAFADATAAWLGWDATAGRACAHLEISDLPAPVSEITATPRRYGFHGTLKPPFRLASGSSPARLQDDFTSLAASLAPAQIDGLRIAGLGGFLALVPDGDASELARIAAEAVAGLDRHRAPAPPEETARRRAAGLTTRQEAHLATWGYPYVMDEFRFHMTLTGRLADRDLAAVEAALTPVLGPVLPRPFTLDAISLMGEDADGHFHVLRRARLGG